MDAPRLTKSMEIAYHDLRLEQLIVIYPGEKNYQLSDKVFVYGLENYMTQGFEN